MIISPFGRKIERESRGANSLSKYSDSELLHNTRVKKYADGTVKVTFACSSIYKEKGFATADVQGQKSSSVSCTQLEDIDEEEIYLERKYHYHKNSIKRSKDAVFDIVLMNEWDFFFTGTLSNDCGVDRYDADEVCKVVNRFMYSQVRQGNVIRYIFVPEEHEDGAIHYHGFIKINPKRLGNGFDIKLAINPHTGKPIFRKVKDLGTYKVGVFNWLNWEFGYTTVIPMYGNRQKAANYMCKYITKSSDTPMKHRYYCAGDVVRKVPVELYDVPFIDVPIQEVSTEFGLFKYAVFDDYNSFFEFLQVICNHSLGG